MTTMLRDEILEEPYQVVRVVEVGEGVFKMEDGWWFGYNADRGPVEPGMIAEFWGPGKFQLVRGLAVGGKVHFYRTEAEDKAYREEERRLADEKKKKEFFDNVEEHDRRYDSLPDMFKARIDKLRASGPDWRWKYEPYEMVCCIDAVNIANYCLENKITIEQYAGFDYEKQKEAGIDDGHSGNTFSMAIYFARLMQNPPSLIEAHGAMAALVGCEEYGCHG